jgi:hypothetical protein
MTGENMNRSETSQRVRFEEVSPANTGAAFLDASIESLVAPLGLPIYDGYDGLDDLQLTFLTLPSGATVTIASYLNSPQPGTSIHVDSAMQNIPQIIFESCQQLKVSRAEVLWFHPDWQDEIDRLYAEHGAIEKRPESLQAEELQQSIQYEPIDCFNHALRIYTRAYVPATYWAMLQRNLGLAYQNRSQGDRRENLERSIECFNKSLEIFTQDEFPEKWKINQDDLGASQRYLELLPKSKIFVDIRGFNNEWNLLSVFRSKWNLLRKIDDVNLKIRYLKLQETDDNILFIAIALLLVLIIIALSINPQNSDKVILTLHVVLTNLALPISFHMLMQSFIIMLTVVMIRQYSVKRR